jgi:ABC-2 type transport system ATP-binding protein
LDEPTSGLDPESVQAVNALITALAKDAGTTVFLCTHQLRYAQDLCNSYGILDKGRLLASGNLETLCDTIGCHIKAGFRLTEGDTLEGFAAENGWWQTEILREEEMPRLLKKVIEDGHDIFEARLMKPTLEDVYFAYVNREEVQ